MTEKDHVSKRKKITPDSLQGQCESVSTKIRSVSNFPLQHHQFQRIPLCAYNPITRFQVRTLTINEGHTQMPVKFEH